MRLAEITHLIRSNGYKPWQVYLLAIALLVNSGLYLEIGLIIDLLGLVEGASTGIAWVVILGFQGVLIGFAAEFLYEQGDGYAKTASPFFGSKDRTFVVRVVVMTVLSGLITLVVPGFLEGATEYLTIQTISAILPLGILLVHQGSSDWNPSTEWPAILAGSLLAFGPSVL